MTIQDESGRGRTEEQEKKTELMHDEKQETPGRIYKLIITRS